MVVVAKTHLLLIFIPEQCLSSHVTARFGLLSPDLSTDLSLSIPFASAQRQMFIYNSYKAKTNNTQGDLLAHLYIHGLLIVINKYKLYIILFYIFNTTLTLIIYIISLPQFHLLKLVTYCCFAGTWRYYAMA